MRQIRHRTNGTRPAAWCGLWLALMPAAAFGAPHSGSTARGEVQVKVRSDGTKLFFNESTAQRARRQSSSLQDPDPELVHWIELYARRENLNPRLVQAVVQVESGYNPRALSRQGAMGLMQLMPDTARQMGVADPYDPVQNLRGGTRYLRQQLERFSNLSLALAAYNAGPTTVARYDGLPPYRETRDYVRKVLGLLGLSGRQSAAAPAPRLTAADPGRRPAAVAPAARGLRGRQVFVSRGENNRISFTTAPPKSR
ncbi:MAG: lytic transglycosylase domain-containing protein [Thermoanaerobaculia bacterium]